RALGKINYMAKLPIKNFAKIVQDSKLVINIHQDDGLKPINPLFFSIPYTKTLQIVDNRNYFVDGLPDIFYKKTELNNFIYNIKFMLENYDRLIFQLDSEIKSLEKHTMTSRFKDIFNKIEN